MKKEQDTPSKNSDKVFDEIVRNVREIKYGSLHIHIQDGKIIQIDKIDKMRVR